MPALTESAAVKKLSDFMIANYVASTLLFEDGPPTLQSNPYVRMAVLFGDTLPNLDSTWERVTGIAYFQCYVPLGSGNIAAWALAQAVADVIKYKTIDIIRLTSASMQSLGDDGKEWFRIDVRVPFFFERVTS